MKVLSRDHVCFWYFITCFWLIETYMKIKKWYISYHIFHKSLTQKHIWWWWWRLPTYISQEFWYGNLNYPYRIKSHRSFWNSGIKITKLIYILRLSLPLKKHPKASIPFSLQCFRVSFHGKYWLFTIYKSFWKIWLESKWLTSHWVVPAVNFRQQRNIWKGSPVFGTEYSKRKFVFHFFKAIFDTGFRPSRPFFR